MKSSGTRFFNSSLVPLAAVALVYAVLYRIAVTFVVPEGGGSTFFVASGFALAALLIGGRRYAASVFGGALLANLGNGFGAADVLALAAASTLGALTATSLLARDSSFDQQLVAPADLLKLALYGGVAGGAVSALLGASTLLHAGVIAKAEYLQNVGRWWMGDALGVILFAPPLLVWRRRPNSYCPAASWYERALIFAATLAAGQIVFLGWLHPYVGDIAKGYWLFLFITWVAIRLGPRGTSIILPCLAVQAVSGAYQGLGFFASDFGPPHLGNFWFYMVVLSLVGMMLATYMSARARAEDGLRKLSQAVAQSPNSLLIANRDGVIEYVNDKFLELTGYARQEVLGRPASMLRSGRTPPATDASLAAALAAGSIWKGEFVNRTRDGREYVAAATVAPIRLAAGGISHHVCISHDVTDEKRVEAELERYRLRLEELVALRTRELNEANQRLTQRSAELADLYEKAPCGYHSLDGQGRLIDVNETELALLGYSREEYLGRPLSAFITEESRRVFEHTFAEVFKRVGMIRNLEMEFVHKNGEAIPVVVNADMVRDAEGRMIASRSMIVDNRQRREHDRLIAAMQLELAHRAEVAESATRSKSTFLANMSHEIRTPLNGVLGMAALLRRSGMTAKQRNYLDKIEVSGRHLLSLINDILDLSKVDAGRLNLEELEFAIAGLPANIASIVGDQVRAKNLELVVDTGPLPPLVRGDPTRLTQILINLVGNAVKFTDRGTITLRTRVTGEDAEAVTIRFEVDDTGIGISPEHADRLFDAFEQADPSTTRRFGGTGLGLAISKRLAELMGGAIGVEDLNGSGTRFWVTVPLSKGRAQAVAAASDGPADPEQTLATEFAGAHVLVAEDDPINQAVALELLRSAGLCVDLAATGEEALAKVGAGAGYALVLMDMQMPRMDGLAATRAIRAMPACAGLPIVAMTANAFADDREACLAAGMNDFVAKPVEPADLFAVVLEQLRRRPSPPVAAGPGAPLQPSPGNPVTALAAIPDLDVAAALARLRGNVERYQQLLERFVDRQAEEMPLWLDAMRHSDAGTLQRLAHSLKGTAGTLGAVAIQAAAARLEAALRDGDTELSGHVAGVVSAVDALRTAVRRAGGRHNSAQQAAAMA